MIRSGLNTNASSAEPHSVSVFSVAYPQFCWRRWSYGAASAPLHDAFATGFTRQGTAAERGCFCAAAQWSQRKHNPMPRYLVSFDDGSMDHIPPEDWPAVGESSHAVVREAKAAGVWIFGGGVERQEARIVNVDGTVVAGPVPETKAVIGGFAIIEVPSHEDALAWAARFARGCRCAQEVREIMFDPES